MNPGRQGTSCTKSKKHVCPDRRHVLVASTHMCAVIHVGGTATSTTGTVWFWYVSMALGAEKARTRDRGSQTKEVYTRNQG